MNSGGVITKWGGAVTKWGGAVTKWGGAVTKWCLGLMDYGFPMFFSANYFNSTQTY